MIVFRTMLAALAMMAVGLVAPTAATASSADMAMTSHASISARHACTRTSSGTCIKGGQFCPKAKKGKSGWDAQGRRYVCRGAGSHPHWRVP
jgi:hypothetical protein